VPYCLSVTDAVGKGEKKTTSFQVRAERHVSINVNVGKDSALSWLLYVIISQAMLDSQEGFLGIMQPPSKMGNFHMIVDMIDAQLKVLPPDRYPS